MKYCVLYNPFSGSSHGKIYAEKLNSIMTNDILEYKSMPEVDNYKKLLKEYENIIVCGGDGTLNYFINKIDGIKHNNNIYYYSTGSGNDFYNDIGNKQKKPFIINKYIDNLPSVKLLGKKRKFLNGVGFGLDGYCCEEADRIKKINNKPANYTKAALKGLAYAYKPQNAIVYVDGKKYIFKKVWLTPTMNGRYYGGGMMIAPSQDRLNSEHKVSLVVVCDISSLKCLFVFPSIFKGKHVKYTKNVHILKGNNIKVEFEKPCTLQVDGDTIYNIKKYEVITK